MSDEYAAHEWVRVGLRQFQLVRCRVSGHRGRFGVEVTVESPVSGVPAFIDFNLLSDEGHVSPAGYPAVGQVVDAVTIDFMPNGEFRLSAQPSAVVRARERASEAFGPDA